MSNYGNIFREPKITDEDKTIIDKLGECLDTRKCRVMNQLGMQAVFEDGVIYSGNYGLRRVALGYKNICKVTGQTLDASCESGCRFTNVEVNSVYPREIETQPS